MFGIKTLSSYGFLNCKEVAAMAKASASALRLDPVLWN